MRTIHLRSDAKLPSAEVIKQIITHPGQTGINIDEMRRRMRILDVLENSHEFLKIEDADWEVLKRITEAFQFSVADRALVQIADDIVGAEVV